MTESLRRTERGSSRSRRGCSWSCAESRLLGHPSLSGVSASTSAEPPLSSFKRWLGTLCLGWPCHPNPESHSSLQSRYHPDLTLSSGCSASASSSHTDRCSPPYGRNLNGYLQGAWGSPVLCLGAYGPGSRSVLSTAESCPSTSCKTLWSLHQCPQRADLRGWCALLPSDCWQRQSLSWVLRPSSSFVVCNFYGFCKI